MSRVECERPPFRKKPIQFDHECSGINSPGRTFVTYACIEIVLPNARLHLQRAVADSLMATSPKLRHQFSSDFSSVSHNRYVRLYEYTERIGVAIDMNNPRAWKQCAFVGGVVIQS